ncbi:MAG: hypothetical protein V4547_18285 [Bacteroidota bacterium]
MEALKVIAITLAVYALVMVFCLWLHQRSKKVSAFLHALLELIKMHAEANKEYYISTQKVFAISLPGFLKLTFSRKEMTLENWLLKEDIELLYNYDLANTAYAKQ